MRVVVKGGAGFIKSNLVDESLEGDHTVRALGRFSTGHCHNLGAADEEFELIASDLRNSERVHNVRSWMRGVPSSRGASVVPRSVHDPITTNEVMRRAVASHTADTRALRAEIISG